MGMIKRFFAWFDTTILDFVIPVEDNQFNDVKTFMEKFDLGVNHRPTMLTHGQLDWRLTLIKEELQEFIEAADANDMAGMADALIDLDYVVRGTAVRMGLPWNELWADVHKCNMSKTRGVGARGANGPDVVKPDGWVGPKTSSILTAAGFDSSDLAGQR